jgi:hypothetical protein
MKTPSGVRQAKRSVKKSVMKVDKIDRETNRLTDEHGRLKFMKTSKYINTLIQKEN